MSKKIILKIVMYSILYLLLFFTVYQLFFEGIFSTFEKQRQDSILGNSIGTLLFFIGSILLYFFLSKWISKAKGKYLYLVIVKSVIFIFIACFQSILSYSTFYVEMNYVENSEISSAISNELNLALQSPDFSNLSDEKRTELLKSIPKIIDKSTNGTTLHDYYDRSGWIVSLTSIISMLVLTFSIFPAIDDYHLKKENYIE